MFFDTIIDIGSATIELIGRAEAPAPNTPAGGIDHLALHVANVDDAHAELVEKGVRIRSEPRDFKDVRICYFLIPMAMCWS